MKKWVKLQAKTISLKFFLKKIQIYAGEMQTLSATESLDYNKIL